MSIAYSQAIRLGGMLRPKARRVYYDHRIGGVCVQGAALDAIGRLARGSENDCVIAWNSNWSSMVEYFPWAHTMPVDEQDIPPIIQVRLRNSITPWTVRGISYVLNDRTDWTREQIAEWVERMEQKYGYAPVETDECQAALVACTEEACD